MITAFGQELFGAKNRSIHTLEAYGHDLTNFVAFLHHVLGEVPITVEHLETVSIQMLRAFLSHLKEEGHCQAATLARKISALRTFYRFLEAHLGIRNEAIAVLRLPRKGRLLPKPVSLEHMDILLTHFLDAAQADWTHLRDLALLGLFYGCGLRLGEALALKGSTPVGEQLCVYGKRGKYRMVPVLPLVREWVEAYKRACPYPLTQALFVGQRGAVLNPRQVRAVMMRVRRQYGLSEKITPHSFRHTCATQLLKRGANLRQVQELLGHTSLRATQIYTDITPDDVLEHYKASHPRA